MPQRGFHRDGPVQGRDPVLQAAKAEPAVDDCRSRSVIGDGDPQAVVLHVDGDGNLLGGGVFDGVTQRLRDDEVAG